MPSAHLDIPHELTLRARVLHVKELGVAVMAIHKQAISLRDVVAAEGRIEAQRYLQERLAELDFGVRSKQWRLEDCESSMRAADSKTTRRFTISWTPKIVSQTMGFAWRLGKNS